MKRNQTSVTNGIENILFPMEYCRITQGDNEGTHKGTFAIDNGGKDSGIDPIYAPFSMHLVAYDTEKNGNAIFFESDNKVRFADGTIDYCTFMFIHDDYIEDIKKVKHFYQGQEFGDEGIAGNATGPHSHIEVAKGKFSHCYDRNEFGVYHLPNNMPIEKACFMDDTVILSGVADWKYTKDIVAANEVDQVLHPGERFVFADSYVVEKVDKSKDMVYNSTLGGWLPAGPLREVNGNNDQILRVGEQFTIDGVFTVEAVSAKYNSVKVKELGFYVLADSLTEV